MVTTTGSATWRLPLFLRRLTGAWRGRRAPDLREPRDWQRTHSLWMLVFNGLLVLAAVAGWVAVRQQIGLTKQQAADSAEDTAKSLEQATRAADAASQGADAAIKAADAAERSVAALRESTRLDQRAWVGMMDIMAAEIQGDRATFKVRVFNSGRSPALRVEHTFTVAVVPGNVRFRPTDQHATPGPPPHVLQPGDSFFGPVTSSTKFDSALLTAIKEQRVVVYVFGRIEYRDIFRELHVTRFCAQMLPDLKGASGSQACRDYDSAN